MDGPYIFLLTKKIETAKNLPLLKVGVNHGENILEAILGVKRLKGL